MIPAGLVSDVKKVNSYHKGERKAVRRNTQRAEFIRSSDELAGFNSVIPSTTPSVVGSTISEISPASKPPLPMKKKTSEKVERGYAPENAFKHPATAKKVIALKLIIG
jgi:hypothetical protein